MLQDFNGIMSSSKREAVNDVLHELNQLRETGSYKEMLDLAEGYVSREVLPVENVFMAKVRLHCHIDFSNCV